MKDFKCPNCDVVHTSNNRYCSSCGEDLEEAILEFKENRLPIVFFNGGSKEKSSMDEAEKRRQQVLRIKEEEREKQEIAKAEEQRKQEEYLGSIRRKEIPTKKKLRLTYLYPAFMLVLLIVAAGLLNTDIFGSGFESLFNFLIFFAVWAILFMLSIIPTTRAMALIRSKGLTTNIMKAPRPPRDELSECGECCSGNCWI